MFSDSVNLSYYFVNLLFYFSFFLVFYYLFFGFFFLFLSGRFFSFYVSKCWKGVAYFIFLLPILYYFIVFLYFVFLSSFSTEHFSEKMKDYSELFVVGDDLDFEAIIINEEDNNLCVECEFNPLLVLESVYRDHLNFINFIENLDSNYSFFDFFFFNLNNLLFSDSLLLNGEFPYSFFSFNSVSFMFILLTCLLIFLSSLFSSGDVFFFYSLLGFIGSFICGFFLSNNFLLFYIFFEVSAIPMFILIVSFGYVDNYKLSAAYRFMFFTMSGAFLMLLSIFYIFNVVGSLDFNIISVFPFTFVEQMYLWFFIFIAFAIKLPVVPFHTWLPQAHVEASTPGSMLLAGIYLKLGGYGIYKILTFPSLRDAFLYYSNFVIVVGVLTILYSTIIMFRQTDLKRIIAFLSISHMGLVLVGLCSMRIEGLVGSILLMLSHGFSSAGLFACSGIVYARYGTRFILELGGLFYQMPIFSSFFFLIVLASVSFPGSLNFIAELLIFKGIFDFSLILGFFLVLFSFISALPIFWMYTRVVFYKESVRFNPLVEESKLVLDLDASYFLMFFVFVIFLFTLGLFPCGFLSLLDLCVFRDIFFFQEVYHHFYDIGFCSSCNGCYEAALDGHYYLKKSLEESLVSLENYNKSNGETVG